jgi:hypothetical protein
MNHPKDRLSSSVDFLRYATRRSCVAVFTGAAALLAAACAGPDVADGSGEAQAIAGGRAAADAAYVRQAAAELLAAPDPAGHCALAPRALRFDATFRTDIDWLNAFSMLWLGWANLDVRRPDGAGEAAYYREWGFKLVSTFTDKPVFNLDNKLVGGIKYTLLERDGVYFLTFRHSNNINDWLADFALNYKAKPEASFALGAPDVHTGFYDYLDTVWVRRDGKGILDALGRVDPARSKPVVVAGHSLGGSLANLASAGLAREGWAVRGVYLTGSSRIAGPRWNAAAAALTMRGPSGPYTLEDVTFRVTSGYDPVARVPTHEDAAPALERLGKQFLPNAVRDNERLASLAADFAQSTLWLADNLIPGTSGSFGAIGATYEFDEGGVLKRSSLLADKNDAAYWTAVGDHVAAGATAPERVGRFAKTLGYHFVRNPDGYGCVMLRHLMREHGVTAPQAR